MHEYGESKTTRFMKATVHRGLTVWDLENIRLLASVEQRVQMIAYLQM